MSIRIGARKAIDTFERELRVAGYPPAYARDRATALITPLVAPRHRRLLDAQ